jgi:hypothetical protein
MSIKALTVTLVAGLAAAGLAGCSSHSGGNGLVGGLTGASGSASAASSAAAQGTTAAAAASATATSAADSGATGANVGGIPATAWISPSAIPLDGAYHWPAPAGAAKAVKAPTLSAVQDCGLSLSANDKSELGAFPAAQADLTPSSGGTGGQDDWTAQETVLATNDTSSGDIQGIYSLYTDLVTALGDCARSAPGAKLTDVTSQGPEFAATITIPTSTGSTLTWHEYLAAPYGYLVELSVWVAPYSGDKPSAAWDGTSTSSVLSALQAGPCEVTKLC